MSMASLLMGLEATVLVRRCFMTLPRQAFSSAGLISRKLSPTFSRSYSRVASASSSVVISQYGFFDLLISHTVTGNVFFIPIIPAKIHCTSLLLPAAAGLFLFGFLVGLDDRLHE